MVGHDCPISAMASVHRRMPYLSSSERKRMTETAGTLSPQQDPIKHVVFLLLENHSFDQMLGCMQKVYPELDGIDDALRAERGNRDDTGQIYYPEPTTERQMALDPRHEHEYVVEQLTNGNSGFVQDFVRSYPKSSAADRQQIMSYYPLGFLPALHGLAQEFTICDHWFASVPGPTWPNRFFALSGTASGNIEMPDGLEHPDLRNALFDQRQLTIFDRLNERGKSWKIYFHDFPCSLLLRNLREPHNLARYQTVNHFFEDVQDAESFPEFCFIEPKYFGAEQSDGHPPHNIMRTERLIALIYSALRTNLELWNSTLLVVLFDEHGGFYDHVVPPKTVPPDAQTQKYSFDQLGVRVPALLVSPWVSKRVEKRVFDHTSLLKYLIDKWELAPLGNRAAQANSIGVALREPAARTDITSFIRVSDEQLNSPKPELDKIDDNQHQQALQLFGAYLLEQQDWLAGTAINKFAATASAWERVKSAIGKQFIKFGARLTHGEEEHNKNRVEMITQIALKGLRGAAKD
jgi:phospholipase C